MLGFKKFAHAIITISGVELAQKIKKGQFYIASLTKGMEAQVPQVWEAVLAA